MVLSNSSSTCRIKNCKSWIRYQILGNEITAQEVRLLRLNSLNQLKKLSLLKRWFSWGHLSEVTHVFVLKDAFKKIEVSTVEDFILIFSKFLFSHWDHDAVPGVNAKNSNQDVSFLNMLSLVSGNAMNSDFAMRVSHIAAFVVVQLYRITKFVEWGKQGKLVESSASNTLYFFGSTFVQSIGIIAAFHTVSRQKLVATPNTKTYLLIQLHLRPISPRCDLAENSKSRIKNFTVMMFPMIIFAGIVSSILRWLIWRECICNVHVLVKWPIPSFYVGVLILQLLVIVYFWLILWNKHNTKIQSIYNC